MAESTKASQPGTADTVPNALLTAEIAPAPKGSASASARTSGRPSSHVPKYALPLPIRTFPLPTFYPSNPLSLAHLAVVWLGQVFFPPPAEPSVVYTGVWSPATRSVHVTDPRAMHDLWCQGFFGKGSLSRSEPNWLNREKARRGLVYETSEQRTTKRREERADTKWKRGRTEFEAIEQRRLREAEAEMEAAAAEAAAMAATAASSVAASALTDDVADEKLEPAAEQKDAQQSSVPATHYTIKPPVGPLELLALPNSQGELLQILAAQKMTNGSGTAPLETSGSTPESQSAVTTQTETAPTLENGSVLGNGSSTGLQEIDGNIKTNGLHANGSACDAMGLPACIDTNGSNAVVPPASDSEGTSDGLGVGPCATPPGLKQQKSVRFSPTIESTTFQHSDPPSRNLTGAAVSPCRDAHEGGDDNNTKIQNKEHLQLSAEEAFFLVYALGTLVVRDPAADNVPLSTEQLFQLFRQHSYFPPRTAPDQPLAPDDPFLVHYAVYHHFRSLGWVPRHGIKFGVDWLLYGKGPALDHAPFGVVVVPSYSDPWWRQPEQQQQRRQPARKSWHWLHSVNRVLTTVYKSMVIVYVDIPAPATGADTEGATALLQRYKVREVMVRRWSSNRNRD